MTTSRSEVRGGRGWTAGRTLAAVFLLAIAIFAARLLTTRSFDDGPSPAPLANAASLPVTLADGRRARLGDAIRPGVPTVISLWASWCGPCRVEAPEIAALRRRFGPAELNLVYLNVRDPGADPAALVRYMRSVGLPADVYATMEDGHLVQLTNDLANAIPRTYVYDRAGASIAMIIGYKPLAFARIAGLVAA